MSRFDVSVIDDWMTEVRPGPCTSIAIRVRGWGGNEFRLWFPEGVTPLGLTPLWKNRDGLQQFQRDREGNLYWELETNRGQARFSFQPREQDIHMEAVVRNTSVAPYDVSTGVCFQMWNAPDFYSYDCSRIFACLDGEWKSLRETDSFPLRLYENHASYSKEGRSEPAYPEKDTISKVIKRLSKEELTEFRRHAVEKVASDPRYNKIVDKDLYDFVVRCKTRVEIRPKFSLNESTEAPERASHPLICVVAKDGKRAVGIAWHDFTRLSHNNDPWIGCIHSAPRPKVASGQEVTFQGWLFFSESGLQGLIEAYKKGVVT